MADSVGKESQTPQEQKIAEYIKDLGADKDT